MKALIAAALQRRLSLPQLHATLRLFDGRADGIPSLFIDRYAQVALAHYIPTGSAQAEAAPITEALRQSASELRAQVGVQTLFFRIHHKSASTSALEPAELLWGAAESNYQVDEQSCLFRIDPRGALHAGLYVDMREMRRFLLRQAKGKRVLNLFCYSGSLGIAAALGGANEVCQVDSNRGALDWAAANVQLNQHRINDGSMRLIRDDALVFLEKEQRRTARSGTGWDIILVDPPVFGRSKEGNFSFRRDLELLIEGTLRLISPQGILALTTNARDFSPHMINEAFERCAMEHPLRRAPRMALLPPVEDFTSQGADSIAMRGMLFGVDNSTWKAALR